MSSFADASDAEHFIEALSAGETAEKARDRILKILADMPRTEIVTDSDGYLHAIHTSRIFRFEDDIEFLFGAEKVHVKSSSQVGYSDLGANRDRVETIRAALQGSN